MYRIYLGLYLDSVMEVTEGKKAGVGPKFQMWETRMQDPKEITRSTVMMVQRSFSLLSRMSLQ